MKSIPLTQGKFALVDDEDYEYLMKWKWHYSQGYAKRKSPVSEGSRNITMQNEVMELYSGNLVVDHIDHNGLNNQKSNLRICTQSQNAANRKRRQNSSSKYKGVTKHPHSNAWRAQVRSGGRVVYEEYFENPEKAAIARDKAAKKYHGEFACLNFPDN